MKEKNIFNLPEYIVQNTFTYFSPFYQQKFTQKFVNNHLILSSKEFSLQKKSFMKRIQVNLINRINIFDLIYIIKIHNILCM